MNQKGYKKLICCLLVVMAACSAGGCAKSKFPVLTEEEENLYADYAANLVLKYDKNYIDRMKSVELETEEGQKRPHKQVVQRSLRLWQK